MKMNHLLSIFLSCWLLMVGQSVIADDATWVDNLQQKIDSLDLTDTQKSSIGEAFDAAEDSYKEAILATRDTVRETLTDEQRKNFNAMADKELQRRLQGDDSVRIKSIGQLASDLSVTDEQKTAIHEALDSLGSTLYDIDAQLLERVKSTLNEEQITKIKSWFDRN